MKEEKKIRKKIKIEDLLPRDPVRVDLDAILDYVQGKAVLVTGGGGSIGSEICRQLAGHGVGHLIIFDIYENNAYQIQKSLEWEFPRLHMTVLIGSVRDERRLQSMFSRYRPDIVFHAAAHKHVLVNGKCVNIPSYLIKAGDVIEIKESAKSMQRYKDILDVTAGRLVPEWIDADVENFKGTIKNLPTREMIDVPVDEMLIVELYSK